MQSLGAPGRGLSRQLVAAGLMGGQGLAIASVDALIGRV